MEVFNKLFGPEGVLFSLYDQNKTIAEPIQHYNAFQVPFAIILTILVALGQYLTYRKTEMKLFYKKIIQSGIAALVLTIAIALGLDMRNPLYIFLLFTSGFAVFANVDYWLRVGSGLAGVTGSSIAHIGFGLIILGALVANANKTIISQNQTFIHEEFPANENLLIEQDDTVQMGHYWVTYTGETTGTGSESHYNYYNLEFYQEDESGKLDYQFSLNPSIQRNERMGNVPEPSTKHYLSRDVYTHVTYADLRTEEEKNSEWKDEFTFNLDTGETQLIYNAFNITLDSIVVDFKRGSQEDSYEYIVMGARLRITGLADTVIHATPLYVVQNDVANTMDVVLDAYGIKIQLTGVDYEKKLPTLKVFRKKAEEKPFILIQAIVFPMINLLWLGSILMALGTVIAIWQRIKPSAKLTT